MLIFPADFKYHEFFDAENQIVIADVGHFESEQFTVELFYHILTEKFLILRLLNLQFVQTGKLLFIKTYMATVKEYSVEEKLASVLRLREDGLQTG